MDENGTVTANWHCSTFGHLCFFRLLSCYRGFINKQCLTLLRYFYTPSLLWYSAQLWYSPMKSYLTSQDYAVMKCCKPKSNSRNWCLILGTYKLFILILCLIKSLVSSLGSYFLHSHYISTLGLTTFVVPFLNFSKSAPSRIVPCICSFTLVVQKQPILPVTLTQRQPHLTSKLGSMGPILWTTLSID